MESMQTQLRKHKEASSDVQSLRADVQSLSAILDRKVGSLDEIVSFVINRHNCVFELIFWLHHTDERVGSIV